MENTLENKAKFFAQYWGQKVLSGDSETIHTLNTGDMAFGIGKNWLELTPLSKITDGDAIEVGYYQGFKRSIRENAKDCINEFIKGDFKLDYDSIDYLRSKGYALPWMGLSVETLVEYGWIKLT